MGYSERLRKLFAGIKIHAEDLLLLEAFQVGYLPDRVPKKEFAALLRKYPFVQRFLIIKDPSIEEYISTVLIENKPIDDIKLVNQYCDDLLWEIAELIVYNKHPEVYDKKVKFRWNKEEIVEKESINGKTIADVGAGSGMLSFLLARYAKLVYAIEPLSSFRGFIRNKALKEKVNNIYTIDGFLDLIPLPDNSIDVLFTSNAIGWNLNEELKEIDRVVKPNGQAIHLMRSIGNESENPFHDTLISAKWNYRFYKYTDKEGLRIKYVKVNSIP